MIREITPAQLVPEIADASTPLIVDFHADYCTYCKTTRPHLERLSDEKGEVRFVAIDVDEDLDLFKKHAFKTIPAILLFKDGVEVSRHQSGDYDKLSAWLASNGI